jgi:hypothetical protein
VVYELTARDEQVAQILLAEIATRCWELRIPSFQVREPLDCAAGRAAKQLGCTLHQTYLPSGGMMAAILDRRRLLQLMEPELRRRAAGACPDAAHRAAYDALCRSELLSDNGVLVRLLLGYWSLLDAAASGTQIPERFEQLLALWFPGGGTSRLPLLHAHALDSY